MKWITTAVRARGRPVIIPVVMAHPVDKLAV